MMSVEDLITDAGYEDVVIFKNCDYSTAFIGVSEDNRAIYDYDYDLMIEDLVNSEGMSPEDAIEWIEYNTIRALPYMGDDAPIILHRLAGEA